MNTRKKSTIRAIGIAMLAKTLLMPTILGAAQTAPGIQWQKSFGGSGSASLRSIQQTSDGGFILGGSSDSTVSGTQTSTNYGSLDYWVIKVDSDGNKEWEQSYGGNGGDVLYSLQLTSDGGYILGGISGSDVSGSKTSPLYGGYDYWVVKLDASGRQVWDNSFGGSSWDTLEIVRQTSDGGYILGGSSYSGTSASKTSPYLQVGFEDY